VNNTRGWSKNSQAGPIRILLTDTDRRPYAARLAIDFAKLGCEVSIVSTRKHPIEKTTILRQRFSYSAFHPLRSLVAAIRASSPEIILPCDDRAVEHLHELHALASKHMEEWGSDIARLIERSLGAPVAFPIVSARCRILEIARGEGLRVPPTKLLTTVDDLHDWKKRQPFPWILKADGTWGGRGVRLVNTFKEAEQQFHEMNRPCGFKRAMKRLTVNRDAFYIDEWRRKRISSIIVQGFVPGRPANCAVVCWKGEVLAGIAVEVVVADGMTGPASVVRVIHNNEMMLAAERIARRLQLSGFFGLDFILENGNDSASLIEMNPRSTPLCHLRLGKGHDMVGSLLTQLTGQSLPESPVTENAMIAYFPQAWTNGREFLHSSFQDYPHSEPKLAQELLQPWPERTLIRRALTYFSAATFFTRRTTASEKIIVRTESGSRPNETTERTTVDSSFNPELL
jgi:hypothetical protein